MHKCRRTPVYNIYCFRTVHSVDDFIDLRAHLGNRLDFLDSCYGEYSLAKILEFPGEGRLNLVPLVSRLTDIDKHPINNYYCTWLFETISSNIFRNICDTDLRNISTISIFHLVGGGPKKN